ncbi:MAG: potassium transporter Kup [bacterium]
MEKTINGSTTNNGNKHSLKVMILAALGIVFGDIGTSPLYAFRECFHGDYGITASQDNILGVLSLMFWALIIIVSIKYLIFVLRADNRGEGGILALTALIISEGDKSKWKRRILIGIGIFGACLLYGDGMITPSISVLSAVEGLRVITPNFKPYIIPTTLLILAGLFLLQHRGTAKIGIIFGPVILVWFTILALLGLRQIIINPHIFFALSPFYGINFLIQNGPHGFTVLGAVFLVVTGAEALYADMGHFGKKPIRLVWYYFVLPALILNYFGQGALLLAHPEQSHHPFYATVPHIFIIPMVLIATLATVIASQAIITGVFSLTRQAIQLGYLPRMKIIFTSVRHFGQIYVPRINWVLMIATLALVIDFQSSSKLAAAYGVAVTLTMIITSILFYVVARERWHWNILSAGIPVVIFLIVDVFFFLANISKIFHGAWFPIVIGFVMMTVMMTWHYGRGVLGEQFSKLSTSLNEFLFEISKNQLQRIKGYAIFLTGQANTIPIALTQNMEHNKIIHSNVGFLHFGFLEIPRVPNSEKIRIEELGSGFYKITAFYGYMETPNVPNTLILANGQGLDFPINETSFFIGREKLILLEENRNIFYRWIIRLYAFLSRNSYDASMYFGIPAERIVEVGVQIKI